MQTAITILTSLVIIYGLLRIDRALRRAQPATDTAKAFQELCHAKDRQLAAERAAKTKYKDDYQRLASALRRANKRLDELKLNRP